MISLSEADFHRMYVYIQKHYGIDLSKKKQLIVSRLSNTLAKMGYTDFTRYVDDLVSSRRPEMVTDMLNKLTTNYTYFMREEDHLIICIKPCSLTWLKSMPMIRCFPSGAQAVLQEKSPIPFPCI